MDDDAIVHQARRRHPQLRTLSELADMGVDGFVSLVGWKPENIRKYAATHVVIPAAMTVNEAYQQYAAGAHFIKVFGPDVSLVRLCRNPAAFEFCPVFITGGMTSDCIPDAVAAGVVVVGSGFDLMLRDMSGPDNATNIAGVIRHYIEVTRAAKHSAWPSLAVAEGHDHRMWLDALPHNHPFGDVQATGAA
jgi:2-keto-3-deoxy-6-phosphogluconate aldolase